MVRLRRYVFSSLVLIGLMLVAGCDTGKTMAPDAKAFTAASTHSASRPLGTVFTGADGQRYQWREFHGQRVLYICNVPTGTYGPPAPGACFEDGSGCVDPYPGPGLTTGEGPKRSADNDGVLLR